MLERYARSFVETYDELQDEERYEALADALHEWFSEHGVQTVLDVGCGTGTLAELLAQNGYDVVGVDLSEEMVRYAEENHPAVRFVHGDATGFSLGERFDTVIATDSVLTFLTAEGELRAALENMGAHLKRGGLLYFDAAFTRTLVQPGFSDTHTETHDTARGVLTRRASLKEKDGIVTTDIRVTGTLDEKEVELEETHRHRVLSQETIARTLESLGYTVRTDGNTAAPTWQNLKVYARKTR